MTTNMYFSNGPQIILQDAEVRKVLSLWIHGIYILMDYFLVHTPVA